MDEQIIFVFKFLAFNCHTWVWTTSQATTIFWHKAVQLDKKIFQKFCKTSSFFQKRSEKFHLKSLGASGE